MFFDEDEFHRLQGEEEIYRTHQTITKKYEQSLKGMKCPVHKKTEKINTTGNQTFTKIYFESICCEPFAMSIEKQLESNFPDYARNPIIKNSEV